MSRRASLALAVVLVVAVLPWADAGPIRDAIKERIERRREAAEGRDERPSAEPSQSRRGQRADPVALPEGARVEKDLAYGSDPAQRLDVYIPRNASEAPIIIMVHGGAWMIGDKSYSNVTANKAARWLPKGYIVVSPNYRMSRAPNPLDQADDVARALAFVQAKAPSWGGDSARVLMMGHSAGAHLVALVAADPAIASRQGAKPWLGTVPLDSAALNVVDIMEAKHPRFYDKVFGADRSHWSRTSPFHRLTGTPRPMLLVCSTQRNDSCDAARAFAAKATSLGGRTTVLPVDLGHGAVNVELGRPNEYTAAVENFMRSLGLP